MELKSYLNEERVKRREYANQLAEKFDLRNKVKQSLRVGAAVPPITPWYRRQIFTPVHALAMVGAMAVVLVVFAWFPGRMPGANTDQNLIPVDFSYYAPTAKEVGIVGDFAEWRSGKIKLEKDTSGNWRLRMQLPPGRYQYQFVIDGVWTVDPSCPARVNDDFGKENSLLIL